MKEEHLKMIKEGKIDDLVQSIENEAKSKPDDKQINQDLASILYLTGRVDDSIKLYEKLLKAYPDDPQLLVNVGLAYHNTGNDEAAINNFQKVIEMAKTKPVKSLVLSLAHTNLGVVYVHKAQFELAVEEYKKAISIDGSNELATKYLQQLKEWGDSDYGLVREIEMPDGTTRMNIWHYPS